MDKAFETVTSEKSVYKVANLDDAPTGGVILSGEAIEDKVLVGSVHWLMKTVWAH